MKNSISIKISVISIIMAVVIIGFLAVNKKDDEKTLLYPIQVDGKWGYINQTGKIVIKPTYAWADDFHDGVAVVVIKDRSDGSEDSKGNDSLTYGAIDMNGKMVVKPDYSSITMFNEGVAGAIKIDDITYDQTYFILDKKGKVLYTLPPEMQIASMLFNGLGTQTQREGLIVVQDDKTEKYGYIDHYGKVILPYLYNEAYGFSDGLALVKDDNNNRQYIDNTGKVIIDASKYISGQKLFGRISSRRSGG